MAENKELSKQARYEKELEVFSLRHEAGARAIREWLYLHQAELNLAWPKLLDDDLARAQGAAILLRKIIEMIENGPKIKQTQEGTPNG